MNQYCRYCAFCFDICDIYGCSNHPEGKEPYMTRKQINRKNNCPNFALSDLGDFETGKPYRPLNKARTTRLIKSDKEKQIMIDEVIKMIPEYMPDNIPAPTPAIPEYTNEDAKKHFKGKCPYTDKKCEDWRCQNCEVEEAERKYMENDSEE